MSKIGNIVVSNGPSDLDKVEDLNQVVQDIVDTGVKPKLIVIDTLNRFMSGDENSAKETRAFLDACSKLMQKFDCTVLIVHHTGLNQEAQGRARGSSAWKGAMDIESSVKPTSDGLVLEQAKSKDTEPAEPMSLELKSVDLPGWFDEDGEQVNSAVITDGAIRVEMPSRQEQADIRELKDGWENTGKKLDGRDPFIFKSEWREYIMNARGLDQKPAGQRLSNAEGRLVWRLLNDGIIEETALGFKVIDEFTITTMVLRLHG
jgi:hypothetical protein